MRIREQIRAEEEAKIRERIRQEELIRQQVQKQLEDEKLAQQQAEHREFVPKMPSKNPLLAATATTKANPLPKIGGGGGSSSNPLAVKTSTHTLAPPVAQPMKGKSPKKNLFDDDDD